MLAGAMQTPRFLLHVIERDGARPTLIIVENVESFFDVDEEANDNRPTPSRTRSRFFKKLSAPPLRRPCLYAKRVPRLDPRERRHRRSDRYHILILKKLSLKYYGSAEDRDRFYIIAAKLEGKPETIIHADGKTHVFDEDYIAKAQEIKKAARQKKAKATAAAAKKG